MTHQQLRYLIKTVECGSISKAADELYLSQPALTKSIRNLESEFGVEIFLRTPRGIQITEKGREFVASAKNVLMSIDALNATFIDNNKQKEVLSIASQQFHFIYDALFNVYSQYDKKSIHLDFFETDRGRVIDAVLDDTANIGLLVLTGLDSKAFHKQARTKEIEIHVLAKSNIFLNVGPKSTFYNRTSISYTEMKNSNAILLDAEESIKLGLTLGEEMENSPVIPSFFCNTISACRYFLEKTDMHLCTPKWVIEAFNGTEIRSIPITSCTEYSYPQNELIWIKRTFKPLNKIELKFIGLLEQHFSDYSAAKELSI